MISWTMFKSLMTSKNLSPQCMEDSDKYILKLFEGPIHLADCIIYKSINVEDQQDFENNYKALSNQSVLNQFDTDGAQIVRVKAAKRGWSFWAIPIEFTTSTIGGSMFCQFSDGTNIPGITCKIYDNSDTEITTPGTLNANLNTCVKTVIDFEPPFDYEIIGGDLRINSNPSQDIRLWIIGAPDIPTGSGGSKEFASGVNLKFMAPDASFDVDGRVTKALTYNASTHQGKMRILLKHPAGTQVNMQIVVQIYRQ